MCLKASSACGIDTICQDVTIIISDVAPAAVGAKMRVFTSPRTLHIIPDKNMAMQSVRLFGATGNEVAIPPYSSASAHVLIHLPALPPGIYLCSITLHSGETVVKKIWID